MMNISNPQENASFNAGSFNQVRLHYKQVNITAPQKPSSWYNEASSQQNASLRSLAGEHKSCSPFGVIKQECGSLQELYHQKMYCDELSRTILLTLQICMHWQKLLSTFQNSEGIISVTMYNNQKQIRIKLVTQLSTFLYTHLRANAKTPQSTKIKICIFCLIGLFCIVLHYLQNKGSNILILKILRIVLLN